MTRIMQLDCMRKWIENIIAAYKFMLYPIVQLFSFE